MKKIEEKYLKAKLESLKLKVKQIDMDYKDTWYDTIEKRMCYKNGLNESIEIIKDLLDSAEVE